MSSTNGAPSGSGDALSRAERQNRKNLLKLILIQKILSKNGSPVNCPVKETHVSYTDTKLQQTTVRRYKEQKGGTRKKKDTVVNVKVSQKDGKVSYHPTYG